MCGRYMLTTPPEAMRDLFGFEGPAPNLPPRYNIAPTQDVAAVRFNPQTGERSLDLLRWGLVPIWAKERSIGNRLINARAEGIEGKPAFRDAFARRRCLIAANGFWEWRRNGKDKQPYLVSVKDGNGAANALFALAGLWERWKDPASGEILRSCTIVTTAANQLVAPIHDRMPVILDPADHALWLGEEDAGPDAVKALLRPFDAERMLAYPVGRRVNNVRNDDPALLEPVEGPVPAEQE